MKPILYDATEQQFQNNGIGTLADAISCVVTEERNGSYELEMEYPLDGIHYEEVRNYRIIMAVSSDGKQSQPFRIYKVSRPIGGIVTIYAQHISYDLSGIPVLPFQANDCASALIGLKNNSMIPNPFEVWTDIAGSGKYSQEIPSSFRSRLAGVDGSILDSFGKGAELEFDRFTVKVHQNRGHDNGVKIRYGKNLTDLKQEESIESVYTGVVAYWSKEENGKLEKLIGDIQYLDNHSDYPKERIRVLDCSADFEKKPDKAQLDNRAIQYMKANAIGVPKVSIDISFIQLWQTEEYKNIVSLERVSLCDTVHVVFDKLGVNATAKVIKTEYDVLRDQYTKITLGQARNSFSEVVKEATKNSIQPLIKSVVDVAVNNATSNITNLSGYVTKITDGDGNWSELVISDHPDYKQAKNIWRWTQGGLGFSSNGYGGPYETAITSDGKISADAITTGTLDASIVRIGNKTLTETMTELRDSDANIKTQLEQTAEAISQTVTKKEFDGTMSSITNKFDEKGLHIKRKNNGQETKKEAILNDDELRFTRADGTDAVRINEHESYFGKWVTIASHRLEVFSIHEWDAESVGGINRDSQTISGTGLFYSGDSEGV